MPDGRTTLLLALCVAVLMLANSGFAQSPLNNTSFDFGLDYWTTYTYTPPPMGTPGNPVVGCVGTSGCTFDVLIPTVLPDGPNVCGLQSWGDARNGGVVQDFFWTGGAATITVTARAFSTKYPTAGGDPYDNGCRVRMALVYGPTHNRNDVTQWVEFPWGDSWHTRKVSVTGPGNYSLFVEAYQPNTTAIMSTLWDKVEWTELPPVIVLSGPEVVMPGDPMNPDTTAIIQWTTDVPSTSRVEYGSTSSYGQVVEDSTPVTNHSILLTGLSRSSTYHFRIKSTAEDHDIHISDDFVFHTPIQFYDISTTPTADGLNTKVVWRTDVPTTSQVEYGLTNSYGSLTVEDTQLSTLHEVVLPGLAEDTEYHFRVIARNDTDHYTPAFSSDQVMRTLPAPKPALENGGFELSHGTQSPSLYPWVQYSMFIEGIGYHPIDGIIGPFPKGGPDDWLADIQAYSGSYFLGAAAQYEYKNGGVFQRLSFPTDQLCTLSARIATFSMGGTVQDTRARLGIDPNGGVDPASPDVVWWSGYSPNNDSKWTVGSVTTRSGSTGIVTVFADIKQQWPLVWHVVAIDDVRFGVPEPVNIGELKTYATGSSGVLEDKVVTYIDYMNPVRYDRKYYYKAYVQESDRSSGICVMFPNNAADPPYVGNKVTVTGSLAVYSQETVLIAAEWTVDPNTYQIPAPVAVLQKAIGGGLDMYSGGLGVVGLRVKVFGKVTMTDFACIPGFETSAYIDDGSHLLDHEPLEGQEAVYGVRVKLVGNEYGACIGDYIEVSGILQVFLIDTDGTPSSGDEYYAYTVVTSDPADWSVVSGVN